MKFTTLIPTTRNDGTPVSEQEIQGIVARFWQAFGACTTEGPINGYWTNDGTLYLDICVKLFVASDADVTAEFIAIVTEIGKQLGQLAMYVEIDRNVDVTIIKIE